MCLSQQHLSSWEKEARYTTSMYDRLLYRDTIDYYTDIVWTIVNVNMS